MKRTARISLGQVAEQAARRHLRTRIRRQDLSFLDFVPFFEGLSGESDRALPIVAFSYVDEQLRKLMMTHMNPEIQGGSDGLFGAFAPLGTASGRIKVAAALYWLSKATYQNLELIRKIRNRFAHSPLATSFETAAIREWTNAMAPVEQAVWAAVSERHHVTVVKSPTVRLLFHSRLVLTTAHMIMEVSSAPVAMRMGLSPTAALDEGWKELPKAFKKLFEDAAQLVASLRTDMTAGDRAG